MNMNNEKREIDKHIHIISSMTPILFGRNSYESNIKYNYKYN